MTSSPLPPDVRARLEAMAKECRRDYNLSHGVMAWKDRADAIDAALTRIADLEANDIRQLNGLPGAFGSFTTPQEFVEQAQRLVEARNEARQELAALQAAHETIVAERDRLKARVEELEAACHESIRRFAEIAIHEIGKLR